MTKRRSIFYSSSIKYAQMALYKMFWTKNESVLYCETLIPDTQIMTHYFCIVVEGNSTIIVFISCPFVLIMD